MLITKCCDNLSLEHWGKSKRFKLLTKEQKGMAVMRLIQQLSVAVQTLHDAKITHRDIKPFNVFVDG